MQMLQVSMIMVLVLYEALEAARAWYVHHHVMALVLYYEPSRCRSMEQGVAGSLQKNSAGMIGRAQTTSLSQVMPCSTCTYNPFLRYIIVEFISARTKMLNFSAKFLKLLLVLHHQILAPV